METRASHVLVGTFVLGLIIALFVFVLWIAKGQLDQKTVKYQTYFSTTVTGLQVGSVVRYRGIPVGEVTAINVARTNTREIEVTFEVKDNTPIDKFSIAVLESQGITGVAFIQIKHSEIDYAAWRSKQADPSTVPPPPAVDKERGARYPTLPAEGSGFEKILTALPKMLDSIQKLADTAALLFNEENRKSIQATLTNLAKFSKSLGDQDKEIRRILTNLDKATGKLGPAIDKLTPALARLDPAIGDIQVAAKSFSKMSAGLDKLIQENRRPLNDFAATGLYELSRFVTEARALVRNLNRVSKRFEDDPSRFLFGNAQKGVEVR